MPRVQRPDWVPLEEIVPAEVFKAEVRAWARRIGVDPREVHVRPMTRKWASCSTNGRLTFDAGLLRQSARTRAEVIVHELLHLKVPNHGKLFRSLLRAHLARPVSTASGRSSPPFFHPRRFRDFLPERSTVERYNEGYDRSGAAGVSGYPGASP
jgi:hypothetical protein